MEKIETWRAEKIRLICPKGHKRIVAQMVCEEENWIEVLCATCWRTIWYNGA